jgi:hypothetical protein
MLTSSAQPGYVSTAAGPSILWGGSVTEMRYTSLEQVIDRVQTELLARAHDVAEDRPQTCADCGAGLDSSSERVHICKLCYANRLFWPALSSGARYVKPTAVRR